jgi:CRISPR type I-F-associated protein Csy1
MQTYQKINAEVLNKAALAAQKEGSGLTATDWLSDNYKKFSQLVYTTHPIKYIHSGINVKQVIDINQESTKNLDYFYSKNSTGTIQYDFYGNAAAYGLIKFLNYSVNENETLFITIKNFSLAELKNLLKETLNPGIDQKLLVGITEAIYSFCNPDRSKLELHQRMKLLYFPIDEENFHIVIPSICSQTLLDWNNTVRDINFGERSKELDIKSKKRDHSDDYLISKARTLKINYGGSKAQNVSYMNSKVAGGVPMLYSGPNFRTNTELIKDIYKLVNGTRSLFRIILDQYDYYFKTLDQTYASYKLSVAEKEERVINEALNKICTLVISYIGEIHSLKTDLLDKLKNASDQDLPRYVKAVLVPGLLNELKNLTPKSNDKQNDVEVENSNRQSYDSLLDKFYKGLANYITVRIENEKDGLYMQRHKVIDDGDRSAIKNQIRRIMKSRLEGMLNV